MRHFAFLFLSSLFLFPGTSSAVAAPAEPEQGQTVVPQLIIVHEAQPANSAEVVRVDPNSLQLLDGHSTPAASREGTRRWGEAPGELPPTAATPVESAHRWIAMDPSTYRRWSKVFQAAGLIGGISLLGLLLIFFHNCALARELTKRRQIQLELERTRDGLMRANQEKGELIHMVAHDLRGPLTAIQLGVSLLELDPPLSAESRTSTSLRIAEATGQMRKLISDVLSAQNVEEGRFAPHFVDGDASHLASLAATSLAPVAEHKQITIETLLPEAAVPIVTDFIALRQMVENLLSNAVKYSPQGSRVELVVSATPTNCRFEVRDQGPGVRLEEREQIFEKFGRGSAVPTLGEESVGLGLWIVRRFAQALQGSVWCEAGTGGVGSVFVVEVPLVPAVV